MCFNLLDRRVFGGDDVDHRSALRALSTYGLLSRAKAVN
jgi:hypothetical protein